MKYVVFVNGTQHTVELDGDTVTVDGRTSVVSMAARPGSGAVSVLLDGVSHPLLATPLPKGKWMLSRDGQPVLAEVLDERSAKIRELSALSAGATNAGALKAPMPGMVVQVAVEEGDVVEGGARLVIVEAMKMENELRAAAGARVERVLVAPGEAVEKDQVLIEFADLEAS